VSNLIERGKTNIVAKEIYWKNIYQNIKIAFVEFCAHLNVFLNVTFCVKRFGLYWFLACARHYIYHGSYELTYLNQRIRKVHE
jgi:hypothetical protein